MKKIIITIAGLCLSLVYTLAAMPRIDLSENHHIDRVLESGLNYKVYDAGPGRGSPFVRFMDQDVEVLFPGGRAVYLRVRRANFTYERDGQIITASLFTELMPDNEAANLARIVMTSFNQSTSDIERWEKEVAEGIDHYPSRFEDLRTATGWNHYPNLIFRIKDSQNPTYEWEGELGLRWSSRQYPEGWSESQAAIDNPKPPPGYERISLNPPSGRFYDRVEGIEMATGLDLTPENNQPGKGSELLPEPEPLMENELSQNLSPTTSSVQEPASYLPWVMAVFLLLAIAVIISLALRNRRR